MAMHDDTNALMSVEMHIIAKRILDCYLFDSFYNEWVLFRV